jgi:hypothetical protein
LTQAAAADRLNALLPLVSSGALIYSAITSQREILNRAVKNRVAGTSMACPDSISIKG